MLAKLKSKNMSVIESGDFESYAWWGTFTAERTPRAIVDVSAMRGRRHCALQSRAASSTCIKDDF